MKVALTDALFTPASVSDIKDCSTLAEAHVLAVALWCGAEEVGAEVSRKSTWVSARCRSEMANITGA